MAHVSRRSPKYIVIGKICKYLAFDIGMACLPLLVDGLICFAYDLKIDSIYDYSIQLCVMTIVLAATSIKGAIEGKILKKNPWIFWTVLVSSIIIIAISLLLYGIMEYRVLSAEIDIGYGPKPFVLFVIAYILSFVLGLLVQIGGGIDG